MAEHSRRVLCRPHRWHVQEAGTGPTLLLLHGAGGASQSWRGLFPLLAEDHHVIAVDLPGQGFTQMGARMRCGLDPMAADLAALLAAEGWTPDALVGHSAGAALALRLAEDRQPAPPVFAINAALEPFEGVAGWLFPILAKALAAAPFTADLFVRTGSSRANVARLIDGTGSRLDEDGLRLYQALAADRDHVDATLAMMSQWSVDTLLRRLEHHPSRALLLTARGDRAVPPRVSRDGAARMPDARYLEEAAYGHLIHEEAPDLVARHIRAFLDG